jgi:rSAM-associated Gly-rich repeat protein
MIEEEALSSRQKYLKILSNLTPAGAVGVSLLVLGAAVPATASESPAAQAEAVQKERVSERLAAIREAVSVAAEAGTAAATPEQRLAWGNWGYGWRGGWGFPNWRNGFPNFRNWGNGGWGNGWRY